LNVEVGMGVGVLSATLHCYEKSNFAS